MIVEGDTADRYQVIILSSFECVPGILVKANDATGEVTTKDKTGETKNHNFGMRSIRIIPKYPR